MGHLHVKHSMHIQFNTTLLLHVKARRRECRSRGLILSDGSVGIFTVIGRLYQYGNRLGMY